MIGVNFNTTQHTPEKKKSARSRGRAAIEHHPELVMNIWENFQSWDWSIKKGLRGLRMLQVRRQRQSNVGFNFNTGFLLIAHSHLQRTVGVRPRKEYRSHGFFLSSWHFNSVLPLSFLSAALALVWAMRCVTAPLSVVVDDMLATQQYLEFHWTRNRNATSQLR